jgi:hypothetical protein
MNPLMILLNPLKRLEESGLVARLQRLPETELEHGPSSPNAPQKTIWRIFTHL